MKRNFYLPTSERAVITAVLGPTNTGKTHHAMTRMMGYRNGVIGFPLRLLARENYDRAVAEKGVHRVALVTGEEKIIPSAADYFICTVEAMPVERSFEFLAVDEIQLCSDPERGHIFTDRLLRARGTHETMFLGAETIRPVMRELVPGVTYETRERLSELTYTGFKKLSRLPQRSAVVAFSIEDVYRMAEMIRRHRGGTAIVLGALSPRARNAQVGMYQSGEVDYMVATDAIGMGLNMDIHHVALAATRKFDGHRVRVLNAAEMGQIAGRAGRAKRDGSFGVTGPVNDLPVEIVEAIRTNTFEPLANLSWRNHDLDFRSARGLLNSLERPSGSAFLIRGRMSDDHKTLAALLDKPDILRHTNTPETIRLLWDVCQVPDFRKTLSDTHQALIAQLYEKLLKGPLPEDWTAEAVARLANTNGDIDTLMTRIAHIRTWTFIAHRPGWLRDAVHWQQKTREIEDSLSDALHQGLTQRFVDRRSAVLVRAMEDKGELLAGVTAAGDVILEGEKIGHLRGFRFISDDTITGSDRKALVSAARQALKGEIRRRAEQMLNAELKQFKLNDKGELFFQRDPTNPTPGAQVALLKKGTGLYAPDVSLIDSELLQDQDKTQVTEFLRAKVREVIAVTLEPLDKLVQNLDPLPAPARGIAHQLHESLGVVPREALEGLIEGLDADGRKALRDRGVRLGPILVYQPALGKPALVRLRAMLWTLWQGKELPAEVPRDGSVSQVVDAKAVDTSFYQVIGYPVVGPRAIRADMLDRVVCEIYDTAKDGQFKAQHKMAEWLGCPITELYAVIEALGHRKTHDPADEVKTDTAVEGDVQSAETPVPAPATEEAAAPAEDVQTAAVKPKEQPKPELATFTLKRGKAAQKQKPVVAFRKEKAAPKRKERPAKKPFQKKPEEKRFSSGPKRSEEDSPFAILKQFKTGQGE